MSASEFLSSYIFFVDFLEYYSSLKHHRNMPHKILHQFTKTQFYLFYFIFVTDCSFFESFFVRNGSKKSRDFSASAENTSKPETSEVPLQEHVPLARRCSVTFKDPPVTLSPELDINKSSEDGEGGDKGDITVHRKHERYGSIRSSLSTEERKLTLSKPVLRASTSLPSTPTTEKHQLNYKDIKSKAIKENSTCDFSRRGSFLRNSWRASRRFRSKSQG